MIKLQDLPHPRDCVYVDVEANGLLLSEVTQLHALCITNNSGETVDFSTLPGAKPIASGIKVLRSLVEMGYTPVFHNGSGYDLQTIHKFYPETAEWLTAENTIDSFLLSSIMFPERHFHSLASYGEEFGEQKIEHEDWTVVSEEMVNRCRVDVNITKLTYEALYSHCKRLDPWEETLTPAIYEALTLESKVAMIHQRQVNHGVYFFLEKALLNHMTLKLKASGLEKKILKEAPWKTVIPGIPKKSQGRMREQIDLGVLPPISGVNPFKKGGDYTVASSSYFSAEELTKVKGPYCKVNCEPLNLGSSDDVKAWLTTLGWKPTEYNYTYVDGRKKRSSAKLTEDSFESLPPGLGRMYAEYNTLMHRARTIQNKDKGAVTQVRHVNGETRISAEAVTCGTPTARYRHAKAICNIPRPASLHGDKIREIYGVHPDHLQIGADLSGIESRMLANYISGFPGAEAIIKVILGDKDKGELDFHTRNASIWKVSRNTAKSGVYALMYGCFPKKLAQTLGKPESEGQKLFDDFWDANAPIRMLVEKLEAEFRRKGYIIGLDGRPLFVREERTLLNTLLQHAAAMVFKRWMILVDEYIKSKKGQVTIAQIIAYHDELQLELYSNDQPLAESIANDICQLAEVAGQYYKVKVPTVAEYKIGKNWKETH